ncbi:hypothetical protein C9374_001378 [Naegleria lovaniensis]|uniref:Uncharacterized protein n=1 Tax=Naegleria lovaniensis TaxID=51637 RepID=A0AA88GY33_NAELO|nr:uncharacterized protein C9374_001378 [Naegleria lovaniensis]KAG2387784.1 hypothetical protein C9374_001378 [Naegleria lovaniensis]
MKWVPLSINKSDEIEKQANEIAELYRVLFLQLKLEKQQEIHGLLRSQKESTVAPNSGKSTIDKMGVITSSIDELKNALFSVQQQNSEDPCEEITEENNPFSASTKSKDSLGHSSASEEKKPIKHGNPSKQANKSLDRPKQKKVKPIYSWEKGAPNSTDNKKMETSSSIDLPHKMDQNSFSEQMSRVGKFMEEQLANQRQSSPKRDSSPRRFGKTKESKQSVHAPLSPSLGRSLHLEIEMNEEEFAKLKKRRNIQERPRSSSPRFQAPNRSRSSSMLSVGDLAHSADSFSSSSSASKQRHSFLQKGKGRLASDGNPFLKIYSSPQLLYNTSYILSGADVSPSAIENLSEVQQANMNSALQTPGYTVADIEGLYITTAGPYSDPKDSFFRPSDKSKWVNGKGFITSVGKSEEFTRDKSLPMFINTGIAYESSNPAIVQQKLRSSEKSRMMSPKGFVAMFGNSGCDDIDKQYSLGFTSPARGSLHSFSAPLPTNIKGQSRSPVQLRPLSGTSSSAAINLISKNMASPKTSPRLTNKLL